MSEWMRQVVKRSGEKILNSEIYLSLFTKNFKEDPQCLLELGIAIMLDKPITLLVKDGASVPENLKKICVAIEYFKGPDDLDAATKRLMKKAFPNDADPKIEASGSHF